jgi:transposase
VPLSRTLQVDFAQLHAELARPGVTRLLLWQEYKAQCPDGWQYSAFCDQYRRWLSTQELVLRHNHTLGEKLFVDYAVHTVGVTDRHTGEIRQAQIFVAVLGHRTTPTPRPPGRKACLVGWARTCAHWSSSVVCHRRSCPIT